jgi:1-acyl-sn-glycerol-3-phosphate acyltransferase
MGMVDTIRVLAEMARVTAPSVVDLARGRLDRSVVDERAREFGRRVVEVLDIELVVEGREHIEPERAHIFMSNHQSHLDVPILYAALPARTLRMITKADLFRIPVWGPGLRQAEFIVIDPRNRDRAVEAIRSAAALIRDGVSVWIAPEGARTRDGMVLPLQKSGFHLALGTRAPIVPVAIRGTFDILPPGATAMRRGREVVVTIGEPILLDGRGVPALMEAVSTFLHRHVEVN